MNEQNGMNNQISNNTASNAIQGNNLNNEQILNNQNIQPVPNQPLTLGQMVNTTPNQINDGQNNVPQSINNQVQPAVNQTQLTNNQNTNILNQMPQNNNLMGTNDNQITNMQNQMPTDNTPSIQAIEQPQGLDNETATTKKKTPIILFVLIALIIIISGVMVCNSFIFNNPKKIFTTVSNTLLKNANNINISTKTNIDYNISINVSSQDENTQQILDIINELKLKGTFASDTNNNVMNGIISYKDDELLNYGIQGNNEALYIKLNNLYDKTIKINTSNQSESITEYSTDINDYNVAVNSLSNAISNALNNANYRKETTEINNQKVKKVTLILDEKFLTDLCNLLLQDKSFLESYSKITNNDESSIEQMLKDAIKEAANNNEELSVYLLKNELKRIEYAGRESVITVDINDNQYEFNISESNVSKYNGVIKISTMSNQKLLSISINMLEEKINLNVNTIYSIDNNKEIELLDTSDAIDYQELTEEDITNITQKLYENEALLSLIEE